MWERNGFKSQKWEQGQLLPLEARVDMGKIAAFAYVAPDHCGGGFCQHGDRGSSITGGQ